MSLYLLNSEEDVLSQIVSFFTPSAPSKATTASVVPPARLQICEEVAFGLAGWLDVGQIQLSPLPTAELDRTGRTHPLDLLVRRALTNGYYEWRVPGFDDVLEAAVGLINTRRGELKAKGGALSESQRGLVRRGLEGIPRVAVRCGLANPVFDPTVITDVSQQDPRTVVVDTSSVHQGALDFLVRNFGSQTRFRVPSVVQMELQTQVNNYLAYRRDGACDPKALASRVAGPGGQWVLLRLSMSHSAVIERPRVGPDPLRGIVSLEADNTDRALGIERLNRSYADRLVLETALHHHDNWPSRQAVAVLTGDEGLARMSLAEGLQPIFFRAVVPPYLFKETLTGVNFRPFSTANGQGPLRCTPLTALLSELAGVFGRARLYRPENNAFIEARSIGEECYWHPSHSSQRLLWSGTNCRDCKPVELVELADVDPEGEDLARDAGPQRVGFARVSLNHLIELVQALDKHKHLDDPSAREALSGISESRFREVKRFLLGGDIVEEGPKGVSLTKHGSALWAAIAGGDWDMMGRMLDRVPSFHFLKDSLLRQGRIAPGDEVLPKSAFVGYCELAEVTRTGVRIGGHGLFATDARPSSREFARDAIACYERLPKGDTGLVLAGEWLEGMVQDYRVHPLTSRELLAQAREARQLDMTTEGSTPDTSHERHYFVSIERDGKALRVVRNSLYDGSFLVPGRASPFISLRGGKQ